MAHGAGFRGAFVSCMGHVYLGVREKWVGSPGSDSTTATIAAGTRLQQRAHEAHTGSTGGAHLVGLVHWAAHGGDENGGSGRGLAAIETSAGRRQ
jgi:hypothetical protein